MLETWSLVITLSINKAYCRSLQLAVSYAAAECLRRHLEYLIKETYNWFCRSALQQTNYRKNYSAINEASFPPKLVWARLVDYQLKLASSILLSNWLSWAMSFIPGIQRHVVCAVESVIAWEPVVNRNKRSYLIDVKEARLEHNVDRVGSISRVWMFVSVFLLAITPLILGFCVGLPAPV
jgi:hypothetical protein